MSTLHKKIIDPLFHFCMPPQCPTCQGLDVMDEMQFCSPCWSALTWFHDPLCPKCGAPKTYEDGQGICEHCDGKNFSFDQCRSVMAYNDMSKPLILGLKHCDQTRYAKIMAYFMVQRYALLFDYADLIIPIPLHNKRLLWRQYNQSGLIATHLSRMTGVKTDHHCLKRTRATPPQGATAISRHDNVEGAFACQSSLKDQRIILIDDVFTTGATVNEASKILKRSGAQAVTVLTFARVLPD